MEPSPARRLEGRRTKSALIDEELARFRRDLRPEVSQMPHLVRSMLDYIHEHLFDPMLNANTVKARCGIRNNNIATRFRNAVGMGVRDYIEWLRMQAALRLLAYQHLEVFLIGLAVGYAYHESFCRTFHRLFQCTPSEYRLRAGFPGEEVLRVKVKE